MSDLKVIKQRIYNEDKIEEVLDLLGCRYIHNENGYIAAALPDGDNKRSVQVKINESLTSNIRTRGGISGDIYAIVSYIKFKCLTQADIDDNVHQAKMWIIEQFSWFDVLDKTRDKAKDYNEWLKKLKKDRRKRKQLDDIKPNEPIPESIKDSYLMLPYKKWIKEGISWETQMEWETGFDWDSKRIINLVRNINGELIGVKGRAMDDDNPWKYLYLEQMNKSIEIFGLNKTLPHILDKREIILFEGYKSVFKAWQYGYRNVGSIEGDDISPAQIALIKSFGLDIKIVMCYDKDKTEEEIEEQVGKITNRKVFYTLDTDNFLSGKESPVDRGVKIWEQLYEKKVLYTP